MRRLVIGVVLLAMACATTTTVADVTEPPGRRLCAGADQEDFDPGLESRIVTAGPVGLLAFRVAPRPGAGAPVRTFKLAVRLRPGADATLTIRTPGTALLFDRARFRADNTYALADGSQSVRFTGCAGRSALWVGAVLTTGPTTVALQAGRDTINVTAYAGPS